MCGLVLLCVAAGWCGSSLVVVGCCCLVMFVVCCVLFVNVAPAIAADAV